MKTWKMISLMLIAMIVTLGLFIFTGQTSKDSNVKNINFISEHFNNLGVLLDYQGEIGVKTVDDIKLFVDKEDEIVIEFGKIHLEWSLEDFLLEDNLRMLQRIYITTIYNEETQELKIFYKGEELQRWVS